MNIFKSKQQTLRLDVNEQYFIGASVEATGQIETESDIFIDSNFKGQIKTSGLLEIGKNAKLDAELSARALIIEGKLSGQVEAKDDIKISRCAIIEADLVCGEIEIEKGALVNGKIRVKR